MNGHYVVNSIAIQYKHWGNFSRNTCFLAPSGDFYRQACSLLNSQNSQISSASIKRHFRIEEHYYFLTSNFNISTLVFHGCCNNSRSSTIISVFRLGTQNLTFKVKTNFIPNKEGGGE